jgi:hypothetical protein
MRHHAAAAIPHLHICVTIDFKNRRDVFLSGMFDPPDDVASLIATSFQVRSDESKTMGHAGGAPCSSIATTPRSSPRLAAARAAYAAVRAQQLARAPRGSGGADVDLEDRGVLERGDVCATRLYFSASSSHVGW